MFTGLRQFLTNYLMKKQDAEEKTKCIYFCGKGYIIVSYNYIYAYIEKESFCICTEFVQKEIPKKELSSLGNKNMRYFIPCPIVLPKFILYAIFSFQN